MSGGNPSSSDDYGKVVCQQNLEQESSMLSSKYTGLHSSDLLSPMQCDCYSIHADLAVAAVIVDILFFFQGSLTLGEAFASHCVQ